jgi:hypothetical protein
MPYTRIGPFSYNSSSPPYDTPTYFNGSEDGIIEAQTRIAGQNPKSASYTYALTDAGRLVVVTNAAAVTLTVPPNASVAFPVDTLLMAGQGGAGVITLTPGSGVTINGRGGALKTAGQYATATLWQQATNVWWAWGDLTT